MCGATVDTDLADIPGVWQQRLEEFQFVFPISGELGVEAESCSNATALRRKRFRALVCGGCGSH
jgi:hypothetical protein